MAGQERRSFLPTNLKREASKPQELVILNGHQIPILSGEIREKASRLFIKVKREKMPISSQRLSKTLYPNDPPETANRNIGSLVQRMNKDWEQSGHTIGHPVHTDPRGKVRQLWSFWELRRKDEQPTTMERIKALKVKRKEFAINFTGDFLSHLVNNKDEKGYKLPLDLKGYLAGNLPEGSSFRSIIGDDSRDKLEEFFLNSTTKTLGRLSDKTADESLSVEFQEKMLIGYWDLNILKARGYGIDKILGAAVKHFNLNTPQQQSQSQPTS